MSSDPEPMGDTESARVGSTARSRGSAQALGLLLSLLIIVSACSTGQCQVDTRSTPLLKVDHFSGSDTPIGTSLLLLDSNRVELNYSGRWVYCSKADPERMSKVLRMLDEQSLSNFRHSEGIGLHEEEIRIYSGDQQVFFVRSDLPPEVQAALRLLDQLFLDAFGKQYRIRLSGE